MLFQILQREGSLKENIILFAVMLITLLGSITLHELAHGFASLSLGDPTAKEEGRLSFNPLKHLEPLGTACLVVCGFGWAKPVPIDPRYYRNPKRGTAFVASAGPLTNLFIGVWATVRLTAMVWCFESGISSSMLIFSLINDYWYGIITTALYIILYYNFLLAVFNLLPLPPFDGSRLLFAVLPDKYYFSLMRYEKLIMIVVFFLLWTGIFTGVFEAIVDFIITAVGSVVIVILQFAYKIFI